MLWPLSFSRALPLGLAASLLAGATEARAQITIVPSGPAATSAEGVEAALSRGASLAEDADTRAVEVLGAAAQASSILLVEAGGRRLLAAPPESMPGSGPLREATQRSARAHLAWGQAAERFAQRDIAITALARAYRLAGPNRGGSNILSRDAFNGLSAALREGLPQVAADDTLDTLSSLALWKPRRFSFEMPSGALGPSSTAAGAGTSAASPRIEMLITQGKAFPPEAMTVGGEKNVVAPLYRPVAADALPPVLRLGYMVAGYQKQSGGANAGLWELKARVFYPHPIFTRGHRDDRPRAEAVCAQFLRVHALDAAALGLGNPYARDTSVRTAARNIGAREFPELPTNLWMSEVSAMWPSDDDDPETADDRGAKMPKVNTQSPVVRPPDIAETPFSMPWLAAGQMSDAPGDILFFKSGQPRGEAEWLREIAHEYGHVALAPIGAYRPPLEPFGNGTVGETLAMLWAASSPQSFDSEPFAPPGGTSPTAPGFAPAPTPAPRPIPALATPRSTPGVGRRPGASATSATRGSVVRGSDRGSDRNGGAVAEEADEEVLPPDTSSEALRRAALAHVAREAVPALRLWSAQGPASALRRDGTLSGLKYLQGFCVWAERVYGALSLGAAMRPSIERSAFSWRNNVRIVASSPGSLIADWETTQALALKGGSRLPLWLPGALENLPQNVPAAQLVNRAPLSLRAGESVATRLFIPLDARVLHLEVRGPSASSTEAAGALSIQGWQARAVPGGIEVTMERRNSWQRFVWTARAPVTIGAAWLSK